MANNQSVMANGAVTVAAATAVAAAIGAFFLAGEQGEKNRDKIKSLVEKAKNVDPEAYLDILEATVKHYRYIRKDPQELFALGKELKKIWDRDFATTS
jgi:hypothetical protein